MMLTIVCDRWDSEGGGCERYLADLVSYTTLAGIKTRVYASRIGEQASSKKIRRISHIRWPGVLADYLYCKKVGIELAAMSEQTILALRPFLKATHYQLHTGLYTASFEAERESLPSPIRRFLYPVANRLNARRQRLLRLQKNMLTGPERPLIMVFSHFTARELQRRHHISSEEITLVPHGVNPAQFGLGAADRDGTTPRSRSHGAREPALLFVAHNFFLKGLHCLLEALGRIRKSGVEIPLRVVGAGPIGYFQRLAARYGIGSQVTFPGPLPQNDLVHLYRKSAALIHPTFYDPCSLVTLEALACGCPVVTTRRNGAAELFESGREGFILNDPRDVDALAEVLLTLQDPHIVEKMSHAALDLAPSLDIKKHMIDVIEWLGISQQPLPGCP